MSLLHAPYMFFCIVFLVGQLKIFKIYERATFSKRLT